MNRDISKKVEQKIKEYFTKKANDSKSDCLRIKPNSK